MIKIYFDMDGTLFDLYNKPNWLEMLRDEIAGAFCGDIQYELREYWKNFRRICNALMEKGVQFGVISWLPPQCSEEYAEVCRREKLDWIYEHIPFAIEKHIVPYGTIKQDTIEKHAKVEVLIDDNMEVCKTWETKKQRLAINVNESLTAYHALVIVYRNYFGKWD